ncbi:glycosyltransferase family 2 protein [Rubellicoccus peritrichatus]|uniref:Glycosyltransferase n=1 Tax=Rubellicoccus peritrichatus TaxID=3080537 RepID=A0AAQ3QUV7_9BACT|nr:glycosyltransferase [Puniceicoccus sp. CR14]WOO40818.1 glycosyltransferase [Puniceicoccus sp. CR14]
MSSPFYSVVIPTYHRNDLLALCLQRLTQGFQSVDADYEIIVSDDDRQESAKNELGSLFPTVKWTIGPGRGPAANRNNGASQASGSWLIFTDDDCLPDPDWLKGFHDSLETYPSLDVMEGRTIPSDERCSLSQSAPVNEAGGFLWSCNLSIRRQKFEELNGFDENFRHACMEDVDLADRIQASQLRHTFVSNAIVRHPWREAKKSWDDGNGDEIYYPALCYYLKKHPEKKPVHSAQIYLKNMLRELLKETLPGLIAYRGKGVMYALMHHYYQLKLAFRIAVKGDL